MEIAAIEPIPVAHRLETDSAYGDARGMTHARVSTIVRVETNDGLVGWGEAFAPPRTTATLIEEVLIDDLIGMNPHDTKRLVETFSTGSYHFRNGVFPLAALSAIDIACWDIIGKVAGEPICRLLGGRSRSSVTPYASTMYITEWGEDPHEPIQRAADEGFTATKIKIGRGTDDDVERVRAAREVLGAEAALMVDMNGNYRPDQAIRTAKALADYDITWIEEPVPPENISGYREVKRAVDTPIAAGEAHYGRFELNRLLSERLVDIIQPNITRCGGLSEGHLVAGMATTENVAVRPHVWNGAIGTAAALQFAGCVPDYPHSNNVPAPFYFEFDRGENPLRESVLTEPLDPTGGELAVPTGPGLGVTVDETALDELRLDR